LTVDAYDGGWFSSLATTSLLLDGRPIRLIHRIWHGPFVRHAGWESLLPVAAVIDTSVQLPNDTDSGVREIFGKVSLKVESSVSPAGTLDVRVSSVPFVYRKGDNTLSSTGVAAAFHVANDLSEASGAIETGDASVHALVGYSALRGFVLRGRAYRGATGVWQGNLDLRIDQFRDSGWKEASVSNLSFAASTEPKDGTVDFSSRLAAARARFYGHELGQAETSLDLKNIDPEAIARFVDEYHALSYFGTPIAGFGRALGDLLVALAQKSPKFSLKFRASSPGEEDAQAAAEASIDGRFPKDVDAGMLARGLLSGHLLSASGSLSLPASLVHRFAGDDVARLVGWGVLVPTGSRYLCNFSYGAGWLTVNGKTLSPLRSWLGG
jgi:uncharacterized protein YdgA (DUF945 family)